jgi:protein TonB
LAALLLVWFSESPEQATLSTLDTPAHLVFLEVPGPSGGSGGAPAARPLAKPPTPKPAAAPLAPPPPIPVAPPTSTPPPPTPTLASIMSVADASPIQGSPLNISGPGGPGGRGIGDKPGLGGGDGPPGPGADDGPGGPGSGFIGPSLLRKVSPEYSGQAMVAKIEGTVSLEVEIETDGSVGKARVTRSLDPGGLDEEALKAALKWKFMPATRNGKPVATLVTLLLDFHLR